MQTICSLSPGFIADRRSTPGLTNDFLLQTGRRAKCEQNRASILY
jgi:hypothetical protein